MTSAISRLKEKIAQTRIPDQPSKPSKGAFEGFEGDRGRGVCPFLPAAADSHEAPTAEPAIDQDEREAIAIELGGVPLIYARAFAEIQAHPPADVPRERWHQFVDDAGRFLDRWSGEAERLGWTAGDLFGLDPVKPMARYDNMGMVWMLKGEIVIALIATEARLSGGLTYYRKSTDATFTLAEKGDLDG
jgi:hypothetical protein